MRQWLAQAAQALACLVLVALAGPMQAGDCLHGTCKRQHVPVWYH